MSGQTENRLLPRPGEVKLRLYGQGLGDCFLLAFPRQEKPDDPCYLVIDCGVAKSTPDKALRTRKIVENLRSATGGHIDALAITHQHYDHISSFQDAWQEWKKITVDALYLPWTETTAETGEHSSTGDFRKILDRAAKKALEKAAAAGIVDIHPGFRAEADFLGIDLAAAGEGGGTGPADMDQAMAFARGLCPPGKIRYFEPGDVFRLPATDFHGYVLGPPLPDKVNPKGKKYIELLADGSDGAMYSYGLLGMKVDAGKPGGANAFALSDDHSLPALASALLAADAPSRDGDEGFSPFAPEIRLDWDNAMASPFFRKHYSEKERGEEGAWRRVDTDWLAGAASLALRAGAFTNNVSLVLAFDIPGSEKMLLFPGDAQVGNWLSWHTIEAWSFRDSMPENPPLAKEGGKKKETLMENLLSRVAFYKVGHHASHNATLKDKGLEKMTRDDLVAFIPVSVPVAQDLMGYCPMPFYPVVRALQVKTKGRVFLANGRAVEPRPEGKTDEDLLMESGIVRSQETLPRKMQGDNLLEGEVPLYLEMTLKG
ncbi:MAG: MBL fold metallo-hydrolase [Thermoanaerobaculia bacterium]